MNELPPLWLIILYIIGVILAPICQFYLYKYKEYDVTKRDLLVWIMACWLSWIIVFFCLIESMDDTVIFKNKKI